MPADFPTLRIVQPAIPQAYKSDRARSDENFEIVMELSKAPGKFDAIIWPESAYPWLVKNDTNFDLSAPLIFGGIRKENGKYYNSMFIHQNGRISAVYDKRHLVPFGEYSPLGKLVPVPGEFGFGNPKQGNMEIGKIIFSPSICYEIIFPNAFGADNSDMVINITNDGWFGKSIGPHQHLMMARLRAMESGLPVVRANYSGVSAIINPLGEVLNKLDLMERGIMDVKIPNKTSVGFFAQNQGILVILILSLAAALRLTNRRGSRKKG
jgi:apolipoprotein N-acyltransferase